MWPMPYCIIIINFNAAHCNPACANGGECVEPNVCQCLGLWTGDHCDEGKFDPVCYIYAIVL